MDCSKLVTRWSVASKNATKDVVDLGRIAHATICQELKGIKDTGAKRTTRAGAVKEMQEALAQAGCERAGNLVRWIGCWAVADVLGIELAISMPQKSLVAFVPLMRRDARRETWAMRTKYATFATDLWARAATMKTADVAAAVRTEMSKGKPPRDVKPAVPALLKVQAKVFALDEAEQRALMIELQRKFLTKAPPMPTAAVPQARSTLAAWMNKAG